GEGAPRTDRERLDDRRKLLTRGRDSTVRNQVRVRINGGKSAAETAPSASACQSGAAVKGIGQSAKPRLIATNVCASVSALRGRRDRGRIAPRPLLAIPGMSSA